MVRPRGTLTAATGSALLCIGRQGCNFSQVHFYEALKLSRRFAPRSLSPVR
jgi:hypothetical protein